MQSDDLVWETIQQLGMAGMAKPGSQGVGTSDVLRANLVRGFQGQLHVGRDKDTRMLIVSFDSTDPIEAASAVNLLIKNFIEYNFRTKYDASRQATGWMEDRLDEMKLKVEKSQQALVDYERQNSIVNVSDKQTVADAHLESLSKSLSDAQAERLSKESLYKMVMQNEAQVGFIQANSLLNSLEAKEVDLKEQYSDISSHYGPTYPKALAVQDQLKDLDLLITRERKRTVENIHNEYLAAVQREKILSEAVTEQKGEVERTNQLLIEYNLLKREFESNQALYDSLLQRLKDANVSAGLRATNIHVIDKATVPSFPIRPNRAKNIEFAIAAELILGIALALTREALDNSIKNAQEIEKLTNLPTLAIIPINDSMPLPRRVLVGAKQIAPVKEERMGIMELTVLNKPGAPISEAFRTLRTSVLLSAADSPPQVVLVTSAQPHEGKTATSLNLACTMAQKGSRTLLIDADLRRPGIARSLKLPNSKGLSGILTGTYDFDPKLMLKVDRVENLFFLPSGFCPPNPAELLCSSRMVDLISQLRGEFNQSDHRFSTHSARH